MHFFLLAGVRRAGIYLFKKKKESAKKANDNSTWTGREPASIRLLPDTFSDAFATQCISSLQFALHRFVCTAA